MSSADESRDTFGVECDSIVSPGLDTQANPIDDLASLGSASDPSNVDTGQLGSPADTEPMTSQDFWATVNGQRSTIPADEGDAIDSPSARSPRTSPVYNDESDSPQSFGQSSASHVPLDSKVSKMDKSNYSAIQRFSCGRSAPPVLQKFSGLGAARQKNDTIAQDSQQSIREGGVPQAKETTDDADNSVRKGLSGYLGGGAGSSKRKLSREVSREESVTPKYRRSERLANISRFRRID